MSIATVTISGYTIPKNGMDLHENYNHVVCYYAKKYDPNLSNIDNERLIPHLIENKIWGPFYNLSISLTIKTSRDIARLFHNLHHFQIIDTEQSKTVTETFGPALENWFEIYNISKEDSEQPKKTMNTLANTLFTTYDRLVKQGIPKGIAKLILPEGMTYTELTVSSNLFGWINFLRTTDQDPVSKRVRQICAMEISKIFPYASQLVQE